MKAIRPSEFERVIVYSTVSEKAISHPTDNKLLEIAWHQLVKAAKAVGIKFKQTYAAEDKGLRRKAAGYAHAKQFRRLKRALRRQRTILGIVIREIKRKLPQLRLEQSALLEKLTTLMHRAQCLVQQKLKDKNKFIPCMRPRWSALERAKQHGPMSSESKRALPSSTKRD